MIISIEGHEKTGKSSFAYTAPLPIVAFSLDMGHERALYGQLFPTFFKDLKVDIVDYNTSVKPTEPTADITVYLMPSPMQLNADKLVGYMEQWDYFLARYVMAMTNKTTNTVVVDTMTLMRKLKINAYLQELQGQGKARKQLQQIEYGHPDGAIRDLYTFAKTTTSKNLIAIHHLRDHYSAVVSRDGLVTTAADGTFEIDGVRDTAKFIDVGLRMNKERNKPLTATIEVCGSNLNMEGNMLPNPTWDKVVDMISIGWYGTPFPRRAIKEEVSGS